MTRLSSSISRSVTAVKSLQLYIPDDDGNLCSATANRSFFIAAILNALIVDEAVNHILLNWQENNQLLALVSCPVIAR